MVANATVMSLFTYVIPVWGGTEGYIVKAAQVIQNRAARLVTRKGLFTSQRDLLKETNWLSINQMIFYHTILQMWRVRRANKPVYLNTMFNPKYRNRTRTIALGNLRIPDSETSLAKKSIRYRGALSWNSLPNHLKTYMGEA